jgi:hypothetical protein
MRMNMKVYLMLAIALLVLGGTALAQDKAPKIEVFGGLSALRTAGSSNVLGWNAQAAFNVKKWIGIVADFANHYQTTSNDLIRPSASITSFMFGPQLSDRAGRITGFVHVLLGASRVSDGFNLGKGGVDGTAAHFSMAFGGGIDANVNNIIAVRLFQADYESIRVPNPVTGNQEARNNFRLSLGLVFKIK